MGNFFNEKEFIAQFNLAINNFIKKYPEETQEFIHAPIYGIIIFIIKFLIKSADKNMFDITWDKVFGENIICVFYPGKIEFISNINKPILILPFNYPSIDKIRKKIELNDDIESIFKKLYKYNLGAPDATEMIASLMVAMSLDFLTYNRIIKYNKKKDNVYYNSITNIADIKKYQQNNGVFHFKYINKASEDIFDLMIIFPFFDLTGEKYIIPIKIVINIGNIKPLSNNNKREILNNTKLLINKSFFIQFPEYKNVKKMSQDEEIFLFANRLDPEDLELLEESKLDYYPKEITLALMSDENEYLNYAENKSTSMMFDYFSGVDTEIKNLENPETKLIFFSKLSSAQRELYDLIYKKNMTPKEIAAYKKKDISGIYKLRKRLDTKLDNLLKNK